MTLQLVLERERELKQERVKMAALKAARLAAETSRATSQVQTENRARYESRGPRENATLFADNIDTRGTGCHEWTGFTHWSTTIGYDCAEFKHPDCESVVAQRVLMFETFGAQVPRNMDVTPSCRNHLCCNLDHLLITRAGGQLKSKLKTGVPARKFFEGER